MLFEHRVVLVQSQQLMMLALALLSGRLNFKIHLVCCEVNKKPQLSA